MVTLIVAAQYALIHIGAAQTHVRIASKRAQEMLGIHDYWLFVATGVLLNLTPGQDTFYILGRGIAQGRRIGVASALGIGAGALVHTVAAALGLSAILATSASAFLVVKLLGAIYLVYLGARMLFTRAVPIGAANAGAPVGAWAAFRQGVLSNVLNPKVALFFLALMPQFIAPDSAHKVEAFMALGLTFVATGTTWCIVLALSAARMRDFFARRPAVLNGIFRSAGALFVFLGVRLAVSER
jgi:threonine/homoserine/homoserine lactone efflux protein